MKKAIFLFKEGALQKGTLFFLNFKYSNHMKESRLILFCIYTITLLYSCSTHPIPTVQVNDYATQWKWDRGNIVIETPKRLS